MAQNGPLFKKIKPIDLSRRNANPYFKMGILCHSSQNKNWHCADETDVLVIVFGSENLAPPPSVWFQYFGNISKKWVRR